MKSMSEFTFDEINDSTLRTSANYEKLFAEVKEKIISLSGKLKKEDSTTGVLEGSWRYGINPFGLRVTVQFRTVGEGTIELNFTGGFADSFDTTGAGRKKATEVMNAVMGRFATSGTEQPLGMPPRIGGDSISNRGKKRVLSGVLSLVLGGVGIHKFYLGNWGIGLIYLISCFFVPGLAAGIGLIEAIRFFTMGDVAFNEKYNYRNLKPFDVVW